IALSLLLIPKMAEVGAALALAGGSLAGLVACIIISERLTPVPVPWRDIGVSVVISFSAGLAARLASAVLGDAPAFFSLVAGGTAGAVVFFGLTWLFHPAAAMQFASKLWARLRIA
ncbi:MAG: lipopolysaccharide biosynthesis protein, partial [Mesorhizobium sp.]